MKIRSYSTVLALLVISLLWLFSCDSSTKPKKVAAPLLNPPGGTYSQPQIVSLSCATSGAELRYTLDGSTPPTNSFVYSAPFEVPLGTTVKAYATKNGWDDSKVVQAFYSGLVPIPQITPASGTYLAGTYIRISIDGLTSASNWPEGTSVRYTLDGTEPDTTSLLYESPFHLEGPCTLKARCYRYNWTPGAVISTVYAIYPTLEILGSCDTPYSALGLTALGNYLYVADGNGGLQVMNISNPTAPVLTGSCPTGDYSVFMEAVGGFAFMGDLYAGVRVLIVSSPDFPFVTTTLSTGGSVYAMTLSGTHIYAGNMNGGIYVYDISNGLAPFLAGTCTLLHTAYGMEAAGNYLYCADGAGGFVVVDVSDPANPHTVATLAIPVSEDVSIYGDRAYVTIGTGGFCIIDISDPLAPELIATVPTPYNTWKITAVANDLVYVTGDGFDLLKYDVSNPAQPVILASLTTPDLTYGVVLQGGYAYVSDHDSGVLVVEP
jgi:hypothetical protein